MDSKKLIEILVLSIIGVVFLYSHINYQPVLAQGDHGRDLYAFEQTLNGAKPYQDYWWVYGPLMPYYYSVFFKTLGINIQSILIGQIILQLICGILIFLIMRCFFSILHSMITAIWFWIFFPNFFFTYNHIGGIAFILGTVLCFAKYCHSNKPSYLFVGLATCLGASLVKINIGFACLISLLLAVSIIKKNFKPDNIVPKSFYFLGIIGIPALSIGVHAFFAYGLPLYILKQCFPYLPTDHPHNASILESVRIGLVAVIQNIQGHRINTIFAILIWLMIITTIYMFKTKKIEKSLHTNVLCMLSGLSIFIILLLHEFLPSGVWYRTYWAKPIVMLMLFTFIGIGVKNLHRPIKITFYGSLVMLIALHTIQHAYHLKTTKSPPQYLNVARAQIFVNNQNQWIKTVQETTVFLNKTLRAGEKFLAIPYDPIYYYLTDKQSPVRQTIFFDHINIPPQQEQKIIQELENQDVNYVVLSSRLKSTERGLGTLGETYCPLLWNYIDSHFHVVAILGDWENEPGWAWNHGTKVLKRDKKSHKILKKLNLSSP